MSFPKLRKQRQAFDRAYEKAAGVRRHDTTAERYSRGNVYSRADIEDLEREHTRFWEASTAMMAEYSVFVTLIITFDGPVVMVWDWVGGEMVILALAPEELVE